MIWKLQQSKMEKKKIIIKRGKTMWYICTALDSQINLKFVSKLKINRNNNESSDLGWIR